MLAIGSNAAPSQLERKFGGAVSGWPRLPAVVPCARLALAHHDVVYCPLISSYGSVPATLEVCPL